MKKNGVGERDEVWGREVGEMGEGAVGFVQKKEEGMFGWV